MFQASSTHRGRSATLQLGVLLLLAAVVFACALRAAWPYMAATGAGLVALRVAAVMWRWLRR